MKTGTKIAIASSLLLQIIVVKWFGSYPELVEKYYSEGIYPIISKFLRTLFGWVPFSVGDIFYSLLVFSLLRYLYSNGKNLIKNYKQVLLDLGVVLSIAYFIFHLFWGMNYYRLPIEEKLGIENSYTIEELETYSEQLVKRVNRMQYLIAKDVSKPVEIPYSKKELFDIAIQGYQEFSSIYPWFAYEPQSLKTSIYSLPLTYMGYGGYLNPFTNEAQVNSKTPLIRYPTVSAHEIGHQLGYSSESATNFIGFLVSSHSNDSFFIYSSCSHSLAYCLSELKRLDETKFENVWNTLNQGVKENYLQINKFWEQYENITEPLFKAMFNAFLKANNQEEGIQSYNSVVGLLLNYEKNYNFDGTKKP